MTYNTCNPRFIWTFHNKNVIVEKTNYTFRTIQSKYPRSISGMIRPMMMQCSASNSNAIERTIKFVIVSILFDSVRLPNIQVNKANFAR